MLASTPAALGSLILLHVELRGQGAKGSSLRFLELHIGFFPGNQRGHLGMSDV